MPVMYNRCTVRVVKSHRAGVGKTLKADKLGNRIGTNAYVRINMHRKHINTSDILRELLIYTAPPELPKPRLFHLDIAHEVHVHVCCHSGFWTYAAARCKLHTHVHTYL